MDDPIRVLHVVPSLSRSAGIARVLVNFERYIDRQLVTFDYLHHASINGRPMRPNNFEAELTARGAGIYTIEYAGSSFRKFRNDLEEFMSSRGGDYDIVHCHMPNVALWVFRGARARGVRHLALHSHLNASSDRISHRVRNAPLIGVGRHYATENFACSVEAGEYLFGRRPFVKINNGIPLEDYRFDSVLREGVRSELSIPLSSYVVGSVGRLEPQKNLAFLVELIAAAVSAGIDMRLVIAGDGSEAGHIMERASSLGIESRVLLLGVRNDLRRLYSAFDVLAMPSLYEGLPLCGVEAQAAGLRCVFSADVPEDVDLTGMNLFLRRDAAVCDWVEALVHQAEEGRNLDAEDVVCAAGFSAQENADKLVREYRRMVGKRR